MYYIQSAQTRMLTSLPLIPNAFFSNYDFWNFLNTLRTYLQIIKIFRSS